MLPRSLAMAVLVASWIPASEAAAQAYRFPIAGGDNYPTAYVDHGGRDWHGGDLTYGGHGGSDYGIGSWPAMDAGRNVVAGADGEVVTAHDGEFDRCTTADCAGGGGYGNYVRIRHADGKQTVYGHLKRGSIAVGQGARVTCGQRIGQVGSSGWSTGPHLHFEVKTAGGGTDDPFAGPRSGPLSYWVDQGEYRGLPTTRCEGGGGGDPAPAPEPPPEPAPRDRDDAAFVSEELPDGSRVEAGSRFTKVWRLRNTGTTTWRQRDDYLLTWDGEERLDGPEQVILNDDDEISPGQEKEWRVELTAPDEPGRYKSFWRMDKFGTARFGERVWLDIEVYEGRRDAAELTGQDPAPVEPLAMFVAGERFSAVLHVRNIGNRDWHMGDNYLLTHDGEGRFDAADQILIPDDVRVRPGEEHTFEIPMQAPEEPGDHSSFWRMDRFGTDRFGPRFEVRVRVTAKAALPPPPGAPDGPDLEDPRAVPASGASGDETHEPRPFAGDGELASDGAPSSTSTEGAPRVQMTGQGGCSTGSGAGSGAPLPALWLLVIALATRRREWTRRPWVLTSMGRRTEEVRCNGDNEAGPFR